MGACFQKTMAKRSEGQVKVVMGTEAPGYGCLFSWQFFSNIPDGLVVHARNSGELSWPDI